MFDNSLARTCYAINNDGDSKHFRSKIMLVLKAMQSPFKWSYDKQNLTLVVFLFIMATSVESSRERLKPDRRLSGLI